MDMNVDLVQHAPAVKHAVHHAVTHVKTVFLGVSMLTAFLSSTISLLAGFGLGWYVKGRGWFGVKVDASNAVTAIENVPAQVKAAV